jgi:hypothetical protein
MTHIAFLTSALVALAAGGDQRVVIYDGVETHLAAADGSADLWLVTADLKRATGFQIKPEGVCTDKLCFPLPEGRKQEFLATRAGQDLFNLSAFARLLHQPTAYDATHNVWLFGPRPDEQNAHVRSLTAPDFTLPDLAGKPHSLSDFRGKKVLLLTWGSW